MSDESIHDRLRVGDALEWDGRDRSREAASEIECGIIAVLLETDIVDIAAKDVIRVLAIVRYAVLTRTVSRQLGHLAHVAMSDVRGHILTHQVDAAPVEPLKE